MPLQDQTDYYAGVIDLGQWELNTEDEAIDTLDDLKDRIETNVGFNLEQISHYSATYDDIEGFIPLRPDMLTNAIYEVADDAYYINAVLQKFPQLANGYDLDAVGGVIEEMEDAQEIVDSIRGNNPSDHQSWKQEIVKHFREAQKYAQVI